MSTPTKMTRRSFTRLSAAAFSLAATGSAWRTAGTDARAGDPITFGVIYNLSGDLAASDMPALEGSMLAETMVNERGGLLGRQVMLRLVDGKSNVADVTAAARTLISERVTAIFGLTDTTMVLAAALACQEAGMPFLDVGATTPSIAEVGDWVYMLPFGDNAQAAAAAEFSIRRHWQRMAILTSDTSDYTRALSQYYVERLKAPDLKGEIIFEASYASIEDVGPHVDAILALEPGSGGLFLSAELADAGPIIQQFRQSGYMFPIIGGHAWDSPKLPSATGPVIRDVFYSGPLGQFGVEPPQVQFGDLYDQRLMKRPNSGNGPLGYDAVNLLADVTNRAQSTEPAAIKAALQSTTNFVGASGNISYTDGSRRPDKPVAIINVVEGQAWYSDVVTPTNIPQG